MDKPTLTLRMDAGDNAPAVAAATWGPFRLTQKLGEGAFGEVYRAFDTTLQRDVALKLLLPSGLDEAAKTGAVLSEARAMARVRHPNVVSVHGVDCHDGRVGFWSDFVNGKTLSQLLAIQGTFGAAEAARIGIDVCRAVGAVHAAGLFHRDIKTGNVMREAGGRILLMDFGLSLDPSGGQNNISGTPVYMAPELLAGAPATIGTDIHALGILLFRCLSGKYPVDGNSFEELRNVHQSGKRLMLLDLRPDLPEGLARVVETAAHPDPAKRYASTGQMIAALSDAAGVTVPASVVAVSPPAKSWYQRPWIPVAALLVVAIPFAVPQVRDRVLGGGSSASFALSGESKDDYMKARDLVEHYYRPRALETAIPLLEKTVAAKPGFAPAFADLGRANVLQFIQQRDEKYVEPARQASLQALKLKPDLASPHVTLGILYTWKDKNDLASQELDEAIRLDKYSAGAYAALAQVLDRQGRNNEVEPVLQKALSLAPDDWRIASQVGGYYDETGKFNQAAEQYEKAVALVPDNPRAHNNLGLVYRKQNRLSDAEAAFRKAISLEPTFGRYGNLGRVLMEEGKNAEAQSMLERAISLRPDHYRAWGFLAAVYREAGAGRAKVEETFRKTITLAAKFQKQTPNDPWLMADIGGYYAAIGDERQSAPLLRQAATFAPDKPEVLYEVSKGFELLHRRDEALVSIDKAIATGINPQFLARIPQLSALRADPRYQTILNKHANPGQTAVNQVAQ